MYLLLVLWQIDPWLRTGWVANGQVTLSRITLSIITQTSRFLIGQILSDSGHSHQFIIAVLNILISANPMESIDILEGYQEMGCWLLLSAFGRSLRLMSCTPGLL